MSCTAGGYSAGAALPLATGATLGLAAGLAWQGDSDLNGSRAAHCSLDLMFRRWTLRTAVE